MCRMLGLSGGSLEEAMEHNDNYGFYRGEFTCKGEEKHFDMCMGDG